MPASHAAHSHTPVPSRLALMPTSTGQRFFCVIHQYLGILMAWASGIVLSAAVAAGTAAYYPSSGYSAVATFGVTAMAWLAATLCSKAYTTVRELVAAQLCTHGQASRKNAACRSQPSQPPSLTRVLTLLNRAGVGCYVHTAHAQWLPSNLAHVPPTTLFPGVVLQTCR